MVPPRPTRVFWPYYVQMLKRFRNGAGMIRAFRIGAPLGKAVLWDGTRLLHPPDRAGLAETILEVWLMGTYTRDDWAPPFYRPSDDDVVADVGANVGLFSVWLARQAPRCRVVALEPFAENYRYLRANLEAVAAERVAAHRLAIGGRPGRGTMRAVGDRSLDHILTPGEGDEVEVVPLEALFDLAKADRIALLKVDVEGSEHDAFAHADEPTLRRFDRIAIEYHDHIRPGTLELLTRKLEPTHHLTPCSSGDGFGMLYGVRRAS